MVTEEAPVRVLLLSLGDWTGRYIKPILTCHEKVARIEFRLFRHTCHDSHTWECGPTARRPDVKEGWAWDCENPLGDQYEAHIIQGRGGQVMAHKAVLPLLCMIKEVACVSSGVIIGGSKFLPSLSSNLKISPNRGDSMILISPPNFARTPSSKIFSV